MSFRAGVFLSLLSALFVAIGSLFGIAGAAWALALSIVISFWSYWSAGSELISHFGAKEVEDRRLLSILEDLSNRAGIKPPRLFVVDDRQPNALSVGPNPELATIIVTSALLRELPCDELAAVLAHEVAHIRNKDVFPATLAVTLVAAIMTLAVPLGLLGIILRRHGGAGMIVLAILAPFIGLLLRCAMARSSEYRADRDAADLCGSPAPIIDALRRTARLSKRRSGIERQDAWLAPMFFINPLPNDWIGAILSCHPSVEKRIARLLAREHSFRG